ncbi:MAG TPA: transketolase C-terminal domain-containing protein [Patescibacteria group bacterium]|nr:transketolase C-terminal domain-containing protein [Patescibacteria group bacterium]
MTYENVLENLVQSDDRFIVMTAENRAAIRNLPSKIGKHFFDVGIAEQTMIGAAAGLALRGRIPVTHALAAFLTMRAYEFIRTDVGISGLPVKLVGGVPGFLSDANGPTHQAIEDVAIMRGIPNMCVFCPADEEDMLIGLETVLKSDKPFYIRYNNLKPAVSHSKDFEIGKAETISEGDDITILTYGMLLKQAVEAAEILGGKGMSVRVVNMRTLKPIDTDAILKAAAETKLVVTLEDHFKTGGLYSIVAETLLDNQQTANVLPIALDNKWFKPALLPAVLEYEGFTGPQIAEKIENRFLVVR